MCIQTDGRQEASSIRRLFHRLYLQCSSEQIHNLRVLILLRERLSGPVLSHTIQEENHDAILACLASLVTIPIYVSYERPGKGGGRGWMLIVWV